MPYIKTTWKNGQAPAINAENLNKIENGIAEAFENSENAKALAEASKTASDEANAKAGTSIAKAEEARQNAQNAATEASNAKSKAENAEKTANDAKTAAEQANSKAVQNKTDLNSLSERLSNVEGSIPEVPTTLPNPNALTINIGGTVSTYDGTQAVRVSIDSATGVSF